MENPNFVKDVPAEVMVLAVVVLAVKGSRKKKGRKVYLPAL